MSVTVIGAHERVRRLVKLYALRGQIDEEIHTIEAEMANEAEYVKQARAESNTKARIAPCGTDSGYYRHLRREKRPACPACLAAHSKATRKRVAKKAESPVVERDSRAGGRKMGATEKAAPGGVSAPLLQGPRRLQGVD